MNNTRSEALFRQAVELIPGGVNSPVRAFKSVGRDPVFIVRGQGSRVWDVDGNEYIDYLSSWGPLILGHAHPEVVQAIQEAAVRGTSYGTATEIEVEMARRVISAFPAIEMVRMVNSGTEATMSAIRLARAYTRRSKIIKFAGSYHGHADGLLVKAGSGATTLGVPDSPGVPAGIAASTLTVPYNNLEALQRVFEEVGEDIAAVIMEPVVGNMGVVLPREGFLQGVRRLTEEYGALLIFDEVITGFRLAMGGAQAYFGIKPDLTCLGKIIGGGLPAGAYGGRRDIMELVAPAGPVYQAGTLSGNPLAMAAGLATINVIANTPNFYRDLEEKTRQLAESMVEAAREAGVPVTCNRIASIFTIFFTEKEVFDYETAKTSDTQKYAAFFRNMMSQGIYLPPSQFEAIFVSMAHNSEDMQRTVEAARKAFRTL